MDAFKNILSVYNSFQVLCVMATVMIGSWCCHKYYLNDDLTVITFEPFNSNQESIYPSFSLCFPRPCSEKKLMKLNHNLSCNDYYELNMMNNRMTNIDETNLDFFQWQFDDFTLNLEDYILGAELVLLNGSKIISDNYADSILIPSYTIALTEVGYKCYTFSIPFLQGVEFTEYVVHLNQSFPYLNKCEIAIHYPNQINQGDLSRYMLYHELDLRHNATKKDIEVQITGITVLNRRNKPSNPCNMDWKNDDILVMEKIAEELNCRHPHINISANLKHCTTRSRLGNFSWEKFRLYMCPCKRVIDANADILWSTEGSPKSESITIKMQFLTKGVFKQISQIRAYTFETLIANVGGYVGLFLGYSLLEISVLVMSLFTWIQNLLPGTKFNPTIVANRTNTCIVMRSSDRIKRDMKNESQEHFQTVSYDDISNMKQDIEDIKGMLLSLQQKVATCNIDGDI